MEFRPAGMSMWDAWYVPTKDGAVHAFYLQKWAGDADRPEEDARAIGHAVSTDLVRWTEVELALPPGPAGGLDDCQPWTGCVLERDGRYYLYYTMRSSRDDARGQRIGVAFSDDLYRWRRYAQNPVIAPDPRWYISHDAPMSNGVVDCRDLIVVPDGAGGFWGFYAARAPAPELAQSAVIALAWTKDLLHWEHRPPAFRPEKYGCIEVPDVFERDGRWYLTCLTGHGYGNRGLFSDPYLNEGTIYAVSERPEGPYAEIPGDNVLLGAEQNSGYSCRSVPFEGERYLLYTRRFPGDAATLATPKVVKTDAAGRLRAYYAPRTAALRHTTLLAAGDRRDLSPVYPRDNWPLYSGDWGADAASGAYVGEAQTGWQIGLLGIEATHVEIEATIRVTRGAAAGIAFHANLTNGSPCRLVYLDAEQGCLACTETPYFRPMQRRAFAVEYGRPYHLRVWVSGPNVDVFVDDELFLQFSKTPLPHAHIGLFVDRACVAVQDLSVYRLAGA